MRKTIVIGISLIFFIGIASQASAKKIHCWDLNEDYVCDTEEDINEDGKCNARDCETEEPCISCWDLNGDGVCDFDEDKNGDTICDAYDCQGLDCWDLNESWTCDIATEDKNNDGICDALDCQYAGVPKTGQQISYATGDDGELQMGVPWPNPRFTNNDDGTVTDNLTGLIWLKDASCSALPNTNSNGMAPWNNAILAAAALADGTCGLTDGSLAGDWRLPNTKELQSLIDYGFENPALSNTAGTVRWSSGDPFTDVQSDSYWSSTTNAVSTDLAWWVSLHGGRVESTSKSYNTYVWPVRGGN